MRRAKSATQAAAASSSSTPQASPSSQPTQIISPGDPSDIPQLLKQVSKLVKESHEASLKSEPNLNNIAKTHEKMRAEQRTTPYYKTKLKGLYQTAMSDAEAEAGKLREALEKIYKIKAIRNEQRIQARYLDNWVEGEGPRKIMRRGVLMNMLQQAAATLPLFIPKLGERPPPLCGSIPAENSYIAKMGDLVAARVKERDGDENWILAEVLNFLANTNKYEIMDIDEEGKERHFLSKRKVVPLPLMRANPETDPEAVFMKGDVVMALYPQTTCFYRGLVEIPPSGPTDEYSILFEDNSYADGYSPSLKVAQRYVVQVKETKRR